MELYVKDAQCAWNLIFSPFLKSHYYFPSRNWNSCFPTVHVYLHRPTFLSLIMQFNANMFSCKCNFQPQFCMLFVRLSVSLFSLMSECVLCRDSNTKQLKSWFHSKVFPLKYSTCFAFLCIHLHLILEWRLNKLRRFWVLHVYDSKDYSDDNHRVSLLWPSTGVPKQAHWEPCFA